MQLFCPLGFARAKAACKMMVKLTPGVYFNNIFEQFLTKVLCACDL